MRKVTLLAAALKGIAMAFLLFALSTPFIESLIIAAVSATITGVFLIASVWIQGKNQRRIEEPIHDISRKVGVTKRASDDRRQ